MRTIVAGSRTITEYSTLLLAMRELPWEVTVILSGRARGVDAMGERYARENNIPLALYPANWNLHGKRAGYLRNTEMAENADALVALWDGESRGTKHMIDIAFSKGLNVCIFRG